VDRSTEGEGSEARFASYVEHMASALGHADRRTPFRSYRAGLILPGERKSVEPIAARVEPRRVQGAHQLLHHFAANADWSQADLLRRVRTFVLPAIEKSGRISAWIVDDTGFPRRAFIRSASPGNIAVSLCEQDNCQVAVSLSAANEHASLPIAFRLYLPEDWAADPVRRERAGVPEDGVFKTKPQIALDQIKAARAEGVPEGVVLADAGYGTNTAFRTALTRMGVTYVVGVQSSARLWPPGAGRLPPKAGTGQGRPSLSRPRSSRSRCRLTPGGTSHGAKASPKLCIPNLPACACDPRIGTTGARSPIPKNGCSLNGRKAKARRPNIGFRPCRPIPTSRRSLQPPKCAGGSNVTIRNSSRIGLDHYEGRGWRGFHHHMALCVAAYGFLVSERSLIPPSGDKTLLFQAHRLSPGYRPRGAADPTRTPHQSVNRNHSH
jgi:SRSO17 transposase